MNYKVEKYRDLMEEDKRKSRNYAVAASILTAGAGLVCLNRANSIHERTLTK